MENFGLGPSDLSDFFSTVSSGKKIIKEQKENLVGDSFDDLFWTQLTENTIQKTLNTKVKKKINFPTSKKEVIKEEVIIEKQEVKKERVNFTQPNYTELPSSKNRDPLTPLNQEFLTVKDFNQHYRLFLNRIQQQLSTLGGGGETRLRYLDDIIGVATNSGAYNGGLLQWNSTTNTAGFTTSIGGLLTNETLNTVTTRGNTTTNGIGISFINLPVGSVITGVSSIVANITNANLNLVLEHGDNANLGIGSYGLDYGITSGPYTVYELKVVPSPTLQIGDIIGGAAIPVESAIIGIGTSVGIGNSSYNRVIITNKNFPAGGPLPLENTVITFARVVVNPGLSIATVDNTDITLNPGPGGNIVPHSDIIPYTNNIWRLGSPAKRFKEVWFGTGTIYVQDETLGTDQALGAKDGNFYISGGYGLDVGEWIIRDNTLQIKNPARDVYIGSLGATADVIFNRPVKIQDSNNRTAFYTDRTGRTQFYPPSIPQNDVGAVSIIGSSDGSYQSVTNSGGMLHITGRENQSLRVTLDAFGTNGQLNTVQIIGRSARGTANTPLPLQSGDVIHRIAAAGWQAPAPVKYARAGVLVPTAIEMVATEAYSEGVSGSRIDFYTAPNGTDTKTLSLSLNSTGLSFVGVGTTSGITFSDSSRLTYFPSQTSGTVDKFLKVKLDGSKYVMSWETPPTITGAVIYKGLYNVETNTPPITDASGQAGWEWTVVGVGTTNLGLDGTLSLQDGDLLIHNGTHYDQIDGPRIQSNSDWNSNVGVTSILNKPNIVNQIISGIGISLEPSNGIGIVTVTTTYAPVAGIATYATSSGIATYATNAGIATYASTAGIATYATNAGIATYAGYASTAGIATYATSSGIATYATNAGIATYASTAGIATYATTAGIATYATTAGIATYATSSGIATYATSSGIATYATSSGIATYATNAGIATYATSSGIATYATTAGIATYAGYASTAGISTTSQGLTGTPNIIVGIVTATSYNGTGINLTGIVTSIVAGTGVTISGSTGQVTINATPSNFISTSTGIASTLTVDFTGPDVIFWQPTVAASRAVTLTNFTANRRVRIFITPKAAGNTFTFTGVTGSQCSNGSNIYQLGGGGSGQASMMIEIFSTTTAVGGVWIFAYGGV